MGFFIQWNTLNESLNSSQEDVNEVRRLRVLSAQQLLGEGLAVHRHEILLEFADFLARGTNILHFRRHVVGHAGKFVQLKR